MDFANVENRYVRVFFCPPILAILALVFLGAPRSVRVVPPLITRHFSVDVGWDDERHCLAALEPHEVTTPRCQRHEGEAASRRRIS